MEAATAPGPAAFEKTGIAKLVSSFSRITTSARRATRHLKALQPHAARSVEGIGTLRGEGLRFADAGISHI